MAQFNALSLVHQMLRDHIRPGDFCIDATAGRGRDTLFLCELVGMAGRVVALDIQQEAVDSTRQRIREAGREEICQVVRDSHAHMALYARPESVDAIVFNFGWLPGGDHSIFTRARSSIAAVEAGLTLLRQGGAMSLCIYYGDANGYEERDRLLDFLQRLDPARYTAVVSRFHNRLGDHPIPVWIKKQG